MNAHSSEKETKEKVTIYIVFELLRHNFINTYTAGILYSTQLRFASCVAVAGMCECTSDLVPVERV